MDDHGKIWRQIFCQALFAVVQRDFNKPFVADEELHQTVFRNVRRGRR